MLRAIGIVELIGGAALIALAAFVAATARTRRQNKLLALLFALEGAAQMVWGVHDFLDGEGPIAQRAIQAGVLCVVVSAFLYLAIVRRLATPLAEPLRSRRSLVAVGLVVVGPGAAAVLYMTLHPGSIHIPSATISPGLRPYLATFGITLICTYLYALAVAIAAWRRAPAGTATRKRAGAFALAFGARDVLFIAAILLNILGSFLLWSQGANLLSYALWPLSTIVYATLLSYGLLRLQLFDLDLKIKWGISRGTVVGIILVTVFVLAKLVENYLNRTAGFVAGSIVAGSLLFLVPKLNKVGEKVANTALPQVQPTSEYVAFKKLEVYRAAVESALETGNEIDPNERRMLDRLRAKLALAETDAQAIEAELLPSSPSASS